jgi:F420-dependent oxidoreductase-like protein
MRICLMLEGQEGVSWSEWLALARAAEAAGLDGFFRSDHYSSFHGAPDAALDAWSTIAALGPLTQRIRLGTLVSPVTFRHPSVLARVVATADQISGGRVEVGMGAGWHEREHRQNGFPFPPVGERFAELEEQVDIVVRSWMGQPFDHRGKHYSLRQQQALPRPVQSPHPPLIVGGQGRPRSIDLAVRHASEYNMLVGSLDDCRARRAALDAACARAGRDPKTLALSVMAFAALGNTEAEVDESAERAFELMPNVRNAVDKGLGPFAGTVDRVAKQLRAYREVGVSRVFLNLFDRHNVDAVALMGQLARQLA